jgi:hypothetical protein
VHGPHAYNHPRAANDDHFIRTIIVLRPAAGGQDGSWAMMPFVALTVADAARGRSATTSRLGARSFATTIPK